MKQTARVTRRIPSSTSVAFSRVPSNGATANGVNGVHHHDKAHVVSAAESANSWQRVSAALRQARRAQWVALNQTGRPPEWLPEVSSVATLPGEEDPWVHWEHGGMLGLGAAVWEADVSGGNGANAIHRRTVFSFLGAKGRSPFLDMTLYVRPADMPRLLRLPFLLWPLPARDGTVTFVHCEPFLEAYLPVSWRNAFAAEYGAKTSRFVLAEPASLWRLLKHYMAADFFDAHDHVVVVSLAGSDRDESEMIFADQMATEGDLTGLALPSATFGDERDDAVPTISLDNFDPERPGGSVHQIFEREYLERYGIVPLWCDLPTATITIAAPRPPDDSLIMGIEDYLGNRHEGQVGMADSFSGVRHLHSSFVRVESAQVDAYYRVGRREHINTNHLIERVRKTLAAEGRDEIRNVQTMLAIDDEDIRARSQGQGADPDATHLLRDLIRYGVVNDASDFHLSLHAEPPSRPGQQPRLYTRVRYTIDGQLVDHPSFIPPQLASPLVGAMKALAGIQSASRLLSDRDGYFALNYQGSLYEVRVVVMPTGYDELAVCRFQNGSAPIRNFQELGFREHERNLMLRALDQKQGLILVVGATGAGKTNTFWAGMEAMDREHKNILSLERPIERRIHRIEQIPASDEFDFAAGGRAMMRAAPNVIIVGETRDLATVDTVCYAAETGHLVMTTLHANTSASACSRLINIAPSEQRDHMAYRIAESLLAVEAQMLVPTLCRCAEARGPLTDDDLVALRVPDSMWDCFTILRARPFKKKNREGCAFCRRSPGERGRTGLFEVFWAEGDIREAIRQMVPDTEIRKIHYEQYLRDRRATIMREKARQVQSLRQERAPEAQVASIEKSFDAKLEEVGKQRSAQSILGQCVEKVYQGRVDLTRAVGLLGYER